MTTNLLRENNGRTANRRETEKFITPPASIRETADAYTLELEMPGVNKEGLEISIEKNELSIVGRRPAPAIQGTLLHRESRLDNYRARLRDRSLDRKRQDRGPDESGRGDTHPPEGGESKAAQNHGFVKSDSVRQTEAAGREVRGFIVSRPIFFAFGVLFCLARPSPRRS